MNNKIIMVIVIVLILSILSVIYTIGNKGPIYDKSSENIVPNITNVPALIPAVQEIIPQTDLSNIITCQKPDEDMFYGGIARNESDSPNGTSIDQNFSKYYNIPTATGICGTYWYIAGWWFNESEMVKLPSESIMYKMSPYAITDGDGNIQTPIAPIPEMPNTILIILGISMVMILKKYHK